MSNSRLVYPSLRIVLNDGTVRHAENVTKRKVSGLLTNLRNNKANISGEARVRYAPKEYNEFSFDNEGDFKDKVHPCIEKELLKDYELDKA